MNGNSEYFEKNVELRWKNVRKKLQICKSAICRQIGMKGMGESGWEKDRKNRKHTGGKSSYRTHTKAAAFLSFVMAMILGISSFATFTTQAMEETGTQEVQSQSQDGARWRSSGTEFRGQC